MSNLLVGAGKACINPTPEMYKFTGHLMHEWGKNIYKNAAGAMYDDMNCRAIAIDNGTEKFIIICFELSAPPQVDNLEGIIADATGFPREHVLICATHNHSGILDYKIFGTADDEFKAFVKEYNKIEIAASIAACKQAVESMRPAKYGYGETQSYINVNRDEKTPFGYWVEGRNLTGYSDKTLAIVKFVDMEDKLIAAILNYGCHATCAYLLKDFDHVRKLSGNFNGIASTFCEEHYGNDAVVMWTSGAGGNQNPMFAYGYEYEYPDGYSTYLDLPDGVGYMTMEYTGRTHGADAVRGIDSIQEYSVNMPIRHLRKQLWLPAQKRAEDASGKGNIRMGGRGPRTEEVPYGQVPPVPTGPRMVDDPEHPADCRMQLVTLGDIAILGVNAELYAEIGRDMKASSPFKKTFVITHTDKDRLGYVLDKSSVDHKTFQAFGSIKPGASDDILLQGEKELFDELLQK